MRWRLRVDPRAARLARLFRILLKLLLEGGELGERRIGIRIFVLPSATTVRLGVILLALGALHLIAFVAARPVAARRRSAAMSPLALAALAERLGLPFHALLALVAVLALLAVGAVLAIVARRRPARRRCGGIGARRRGAGSGGGKFGRRRGGRGCLLRARRAARLVRAPLAAATRPPDFDESRLRRGGGIQRRSLCRGIAGNLLRNILRFGCSNLGRGNPFKRCGFRRIGALLRFRCGNSGFGRHELRLGQQRHRIKRCNVRRRRFERGGLAGRRLGRRRNIHWLDLSRHNFGRLDLRRLRPPVHAVAERAQDRGEVFAGGAGERGHRAGDEEAAAVEHAVRLAAGRAFAP